MADGVRKSIPLPIARLLRQQAGFGCCMCGLPIIQYHHIVRWEQDQHYRPEDMMVLCPNHHDQVTKGAMPEEEQRELKSRPFNIEKGRAAGKLEIKQDYCAADFGTVTVVGEGAFLSIDESPILSFDIDDKRLLVSLKLYDEKDDLLVEIDRNVWVSGDPLPWDIEADWQILTLRERARKISLSIDAKKIPMQIIGEFWRAGKKFICDKSGIRIEGQGHASNIQNLAFVGMEINVDSAKWSFGPSPGRNAMIISWPQPRERLWKARDAWRQLKRDREAQEEAPNAKVPRHPEG